MKRLLSIMLVLAMSCTMLSGCGKKEDPNTDDVTGVSSNATLEEQQKHQSDMIDNNDNSNVNAEKNSPPKDAKIRDVMRVATSHDPESLDPHVNVENQRVQRCIYSALLVMNAAGELVPDLATDWSVSEDGKVWTFHLRKDVKWHDGTPFTAEDVKATFDRITDEKAPKTHTAKMSFIKETRVIDPHTVEIESHSAFAPFLTTLTSYYGMILSKDYIEKYGDDLGKAPESVCGTGPYKMKSHTYGQEVVLTANEDYYKGAPHTKELRFVVIPEAMARTIALQKGEVDFVTNPNASDIPAMKKNDQMLVNYSQDVGQYFFIYNCSESSVLKDPRLRQAINYCVDRQAIIDVLLADVGAVNPHSILDNAYGATDLGIIEQDYDKAKELMAAAGYPDGFDIKLFASDVYTKNVAQAEMVKEMCAQVGINIEITTGDIAAFSILFSGLTSEEMEYDMFCMGMNSFSGDIDELRGLYTTSDDGRNDANYGLYSNAEVDELLAKQAVTMDPAERQKLLDRAQEIMYLEDPVGLLIYSSMYVNVLNKNVQNFSVNPQGIVYYEYMWVLDE